jgi:hypothetical protein
MLQWRPPAGQSYCSSKLSFLTSREGRIVRIRDIALFQLLHVMQGRLAGGNGDIKITEVQCTCYWQILDDG